MVLHNLEAGSSHTESDVETLHWLLRCSLIQMVQFGFGRIDSINDEHVTVYYAHRQTNEPLLRGLFRKFSDSPLARTLVAEEGLIEKNAPEFGPVSGELVGRSQVLRWVSLIVSSPKTSS